MTNQEKKKYLSQAYIIERHIETMTNETEKIERLMSQCNKCTVNYDNDGSQSGSHSNSTESALVNYISAVEEYRKELTAEIDKLYEVKRKIKQIVTTVTNENAREILYKRFVGCLDFKTIEKQMHYSRTRTFELFNVGLSEINIKADLIGLENSCQ